LGRFIIYNYLLI